jgi:hypothetical protein
MNRSMVSEVPAAMPGQLSAQPALTLVVVSSLMASQDAWRPATFDIPGLARTVATGVVLALVLADPSFVHNVFRKGCPARPTVARALEPIV